MGQDPAPQEVADKLWMPMLDRPIFFWNRQQESWTDWFRPIKLPLECRSWSGITYTIDRDTENAACPATNNKVMIRCCLPEGHDCLHMGLPEEDLYYGGPLIVTCMTLGRIPIDPNEPTGEDA